MQSGLIDKVAVTPANVTDNKGFKHVCPNDGAVYADKGYWTLSGTLNGAYMISSTSKRLTPSKQENIEHWYYSYTVKVDKDTAKKRIFLSIVTKQLLDGICKTIDRITWYVGMKALSVWDVAK